jgi:hypothetical protein
MALEASYRLIDVNWRCTCGCISRPTFKLSTSLLDIIGTFLKITLKKSINPKNQSQNNSKGPCEGAGGNRYKSIYIHSKTSPILT